jgi:hypothetical protein
MKETLLQESIVPMRKRKGELWKLGCKHLNFQLFEAIRKNINLSLRRQNLAENNLFKRCPVEFHCRAPKRKKSHLLGIQQIAKKEQDIVDATGFYNILLCCDSSWCAWKTAESLLGFSCRVPAWRRIQSVDWVPRHCDSPQAKDRHLLNLWACGSKRSNRRPPSSSATYPSIWIANHFRTHEANHTLQGRPIQNDHSMASHAIIILDFQPNPSEFRFESPWDRSGKS